MGNIINPNDSPIQPSFDRYWDNPMTRREAKVLFTKLAFNDSELMGMCDTAALVLNFLCEKFKISKQEIDAYVTVKAAQVNAMREALKTQENSDDLKQEEGVQPTVLPEKQE
jgi:hypothetical protein